MKGELSMDKIKNGTVVAACLEATKRLTLNKKLQESNIDVVISNYEYFVAEFHITVFTTDDFKKNQIENAHYHKNRYIKFVDFVRDRNFSLILDIGNDKPFLSWLLHIASPRSYIETVSFPIEQSPFDHTIIDIETLDWEVDYLNFDLCLFVECLEHLWRDPSVVFYNVNKSLKLNGVLYVTTPNACELHALTNILWQAHPNQRGKIFTEVEVGHPHLYTIKMVCDMFVANGFSVNEKTTFSPYGYTNFSNEVADFARKISPYFELMGETLEVIGTKIDEIDTVGRPLSVYEAGMPLIKRD